MGFQIAVWFMKLIEILFFAGLIGCAVTVLISWVSIFKEGFSNDD